MARKAQKFDYDLIIIGSGAGGSVAAHQLIKAGKRVAIIEASKIGGECPNIGCVPTKALLHAAEIYELVKNSAQFGIRGAAVTYNYPSIRAWKNLAVKRTGTYLGEQMYTDEGITVVRGRAHFINPNTISVGVARFTAKNFLIATGSELVRPPIMGLEETGYITFEEAIDLNRPPRSLAIIGGGAIGCEFANLFAIFGTKVHIIDTASQLLGKEEPEVGQLLKERFENHYDMKVYTDSSVVKVSKFSTKKRLLIKSGKRETQLTVDEVLLATGKKGVVDIGLENAGVEYSRGSILVDRYMQTSAKHIYAAGDCVGPYLFTHMATYQSKLAANNILHPKKLVSSDYSAVPRCTFTNPEVASVGLTEAELKKANRAVKIALAPVSIIGRANTSNVHEGFVKVIADKKTNVLLGGSIVSPRAGEMIHELAIAVQNRLKAEAIAGTIHAYPTWSEAVRVACTKLLL